MAIIPIDIRKIQKQRQQAKVIYQFFREDNIDRDIFQAVTLWIYLNRKKGGNTNE